MSKIVLIGGGSASGKTYIVNNVRSQIGEEKINVINIDDYYKDRSNLTLEERTFINYDLPDAIDWELLYNDISQLKVGNKINKPLYDFSIHNRRKEKEEIIPKEIIIIEGIMALVNENLRNIANLKIFIDTTSEIRFIRRITRDHEQRGRSYKSIVDQYISQVAVAYENYIYPSSKFADYVFKNDFGHTAVEECKKIIENLL